MQTLELVSNVQIWLQGDGRFRRPQSFSAFERFLRSGHPLMQQIPLSAERIDDLALLGAGSLTAG
jgi:hypothetical protein